MEQTSLKSLLLTSDHLGRKEQLSVSFLFSVLAIGIAGLVIYGAYYGGITALLLRSSFFSLVACSAMMLYGSRYKTPIARVVFYALALVALIPGPYLWNSYIDIIMRGAMSIPTDTWVFLALSVIVFIFVRIAVGWALVVLMALAFLYAHFGYLIPGQYGHELTSSNKLKINTFILLHHWLRTLL